MRKVKSNALKMQQRKALDHIRECIDRIRAQKNPKQARLVNSTPIEAFNHSDVVATPDASKFLGVSPKTLENWRVSGKGPKYMKIGRRVCYRVGDISQFMSARERENTSQGGHHA